jgi:hypothetical protein
MLGRLNTYKTGSDPSPRLTPDADNNFAAATAVDALKPWLW